MISSDDFGKFISAKRKELKISQALLAEKLNIDSKTLSKWENGVNYPDLESAHKIAEIFNISLDDILNENFDTEIIRKKRILTFDNIFAFAVIILSTIFVVFKYVKIFRVVDVNVSPIILSFDFLLNVASFIILILYKKSITKQKMLIIFIKIIYFLTIVLLFIL
ncbi:MAG: helix-turn-helix transcriptional regulator [Erysipelotrichales bacterium]|nr:helix-turn-helix transcriptional regulator [Erysipelotrichales bacterium]